MIVEQFIEDIQKLIDRGTINPSARISVKGRIEVCIDDIGCIADIESDDLEIGIHESFYNNLVLIVK